MRHGLGIARWFVVVLAVSVGASSSLLDIGLPIDGLTAADVRDTFNEIHSGHPHEATDLMAPKGTPVHAVVSGSIRKLFLSKPGGNTIYQFDETGVYCYYYAHLDRYVEGFAGGRSCRARGCHRFCGIDGECRCAHPSPAFCNLRVGSQRQWWKGKAVNPYPGLVEAVNRVK